MTAIEARNLTLATSEEVRGRIDKLIKEEAEKGFFELTIEENFRPPVIEYYRAMGFKVDTRMKTTIINWEPKKD